MMFTFRKNTYSNFLETSVKKFGKERFFSEKIDFREKKNLRPLHRKIFFRPKLVFVATLKNQKSSFSEKKIKIFWVVFLKAKKPFHLNTIFFIALLYNYLESKYLEGKIILNVFYLIIYFVSILFRAC